MRSNYKKLGQFIRTVDVRNKDLEVDRLLGVSIKKELMPSIANTVGTNMKRYKIIEKGQFAYGTVTSRNGDKISIALSEKYDKALVSQIYIVFEVIDEEKLLPEYLMMWFRRPEFDRYARFMSHGSARETFDWDEMCDVELPVPSIEKQREIVAEYNTVVDRIKLNEELNKKLEETAQTLYKHWFVDFEFPDKNGNPYKSSGGEMVYNAELDKEIPKGWECVNLKYFIEDSLGGEWGKSTRIGNYSKEVKCIRGTDIDLLKVGDLKNAPTRYILETKFKNKKLIENQIVIEISGGSTTQSTGRAALFSEIHNEITEDDIVCSNFCRILKPKDNDYSIFFYSHINYLYSIDYLFTFENSTTGVKNFNLPSFLNEELLFVPDKELIHDYNQTYSLILKYSINNQSEINKLSILSELLLSRMTKV